jgi:diaminopimelate epimerase
VAFVPDPGSIDLVTVGPEVENNAVFSNKANVEFARIDDRNHITMVVWERGAGATLACGTGACAVAVAACVLHDTDEDITVSLPGGDLRLSWEGDVHTPATVMMTGPAKQSFEGELDLREYA